MADKVISDGELKQEEKKNASPWGEVGTETWIAGLMEAESGIAGCKALP